MASNSSYKPPDTIHDALSLCYKMTSTKYYLFGFFLVNVPFILPLCLYILHQGVRQWRSRARISHTDIFTYNMVTIQLLGIVGSCLLTLNFFLHCDVLIMIGIYIVIVNYIATTFFQIFTCLERYLAVIHPVTYLSLKSQTGSLIRNISCTFVWLNSAIQSISSFLANIDEYSYMSLTCLSAFALVVLFCNLSVLRALIRPAPGDGAKGIQSKRRAFCTITAITGTFLLNFVSDVVGLSGFSFMNSAHESCSLWFAMSWLTLPSMLVLPILYLHRNGKLPHCKANK